MATLLPGWRRVNRIETILLHLEVTCQIVPVITPLPHAYPPRQRRHRHLPSCRVQFRARAYVLRPDFHNRVYHQLWLMSMDLVRLLESPALCGRSTSRHTPAPISRGWAGVRHTRQAALRVHISFGLQQEMACSHMEHRPGHRSRHPRRFASVYRGKHCLSGRAWDARRRRGGTHPVGQIPADVLQFARQRPRSHRIPVATTESRKAGIDNRRRWSSGRFR